MLAGRATRVAARIQHAIAGLDDDQHTNADACVTYLLNKARYLRYHHALAQGWPIATGVIEGGQDGPDNIRLMHTYCQRRTIGKGSKQPEPSCT